MSRPSTPYFGAKAWMPGTRPGMTVEIDAGGAELHSCPPVSELDVLEEPQHPRPGKAAEARVVDRIGDEEVPGPRNDDAADIEARLNERVEKRDRLGRRVDDVV